MSTVYNADEVLEIAERIEIEGEAFYRGAAGKVESDEARNLFTTLADWETRHRATFAKLRETVERAPAERVQLDPNQEEALYLQAIAEGRIFDLREGPEALLARCAGMEDMVRAALQKEKDAVIFYSALGGAMAEEEDKRLLGEIVKEEMSHVRHLSNLLAKVTRPPETTG